MSKRFKGGHFALGLALGAFVVTVLALAVSDYGAGCYLTDGIANGYQAEGVKPDKRCWIIPFFVYGEDTLAQWIMAILTVVAVWMLWRTLELTRGANEAAVQAATAALQANQIMQDQAAGYLVIEKVEVQSRKSDVLLRATVKNIGKRPVRTGKITGTLEFVLPPQSKENVSKLHRIRLKAEIFVGVVEAGQKGYGLSALPWTGVTNDYEIYSRYIHTLGGSGVGYDCSISWSDSLEIPRSERHIMHPLDDDTILESRLGPITTLTIGYSGMSRDWEERQAQNGDDD